MVRISSKVFLSLIYCCNASFWIDFNKWKKDLSVCSILLFCKRIRCEAIGCEAYSLQAWCLPYPLHPSIFPYPPLIDRCSTSISIKAEDRSTWIRKLAVHHPCITITISHSAVPVTHQNLNPKIPGAYSQNPKNCQNPTIVLVLSSPTTPNQIPQQQTTSFAKSVPTENIPSYPGP